MLNAYTDKKLEGASVVILPDADGLNHPLQQKIAREFNADQTVFITPSSSG
jgi:predicted PhzF superfamily epimerase YddE/YHI9